MLGVLGRRPPHSSTTSPPRAGRPSTASASLSSCPAACPGTTRPSAPRRTPVATLRTSLVSPSCASTYRMVDARRFVMLDHSQVNKVAYLDAIVPRNGRCDAGIWPPSLPTPRTTRVPRPPAQVVHCWRAGVPRPARMRRSWSHISKGELNEYGIDV